MSISLFPHALLWWCVGSCRLNALLARGATPNSQPPAASASAAATDSKTASAAGSGAGAAPPAGYGFPVIIRLFEFICALTDWSLTGLFPHSPSSFVGSAAASKGIDTPILGAGLDPTSPPAFDPSLVVFNEAKRTGGSGSAEQNESDANARTMLTAHLLLTVFEVSADSIAKACLACDSCLCALSCQQFVD
jgi:hypothetical protein